MRKYRPLPSQARLHEILNYDPETGIFTRRINRHKWKSGQVCGTPSADGYINISVDYLIYRAHRLAWVYMTGSDPELGIDHINGVRNDNRWCNLREASQTENLCNKRVMKNSKLGVKGVYAGQRPGSYVARINKDKKAFHLGVFNSVDEAKAAYDAAAKVLHGAFFRSG